MFRDSADLGVSYAFFGCDACARGRFPEPRWIFGPLSGASERFRFIPSAKKANLYSEGAKTPCDKSSQVWIVEFPDCVWTTLKTYNIFTIYKESVLPEPHFSLDWI